MPMQNANGGIVLTSASIAGHPVAQMDAVMVLGFLSAFLTLAFFINRNETRAAMFALAVCLAGTAVYGFMQGAWPLGIIQALWSMVTFRQALAHRSGLRPRQRRAVVARSERLVVSETRLRRMFGPM
jgi:hypothetical protein